MENTTSFISKLGFKWNSVRYWVKEYFGENEYERYVASWKAAHENLHGTEIAECHLPLMSPKEFYQYQLDLKYGKDMKRCC